MSDDDHPVAIVTGAASGIGLALTKFLISKGWCVAMADLSAAGEAIATSLGPNATFHRVNVASWEVQEALFKATWERYGRLDFHGANAGIDDKDSLYRETSEEREGGPKKPNLVTLDVDLIGPIYGLKLAAYYMRRNKNKGGCVVMTSSMMGLYPFPLNPQYCAAKHGIVGLVRSVGPIFAKEDIRVNCICPALVPTALGPKELLENIPKEHITPMETVMRAFETFIKEPKRSGQVCECTLDQCFYRKHVEYPNESQRWMHEGPNSFWSSIPPADDSHSVSIK